jgi:hypothetical protein
MPNSVGCNSNQPLSSCPEKELETNHGDGTADPAVTYKMLEVYMLYVITVSVSKEVYSNEQNE